VRDAATLLGVIAGHDPKDATSSPAPVEDYASESDKPVKEPGKAGLRIGVPAEYFAEGLDPEVRAAIEKGIAALEAAGCTIKPVSLPHTKYAVPTYYLVATAEASANLARFDGVRYGHRSPHSATLSDMYSHSRDEGFGAEVKRRIFLGTYALSAGYYDAYYLKAQQVRRILAEEFLRAHLADPGLQDRREERRSAGHVPCRHLHRYCESRRHLRCHGTLRRNQSRPSRGHANSRPPSRRKHGLPRRPRRRSSANLTLRYNHPAAFFHHGPSPAWSPYFPKSVFPGIRLVSGRERGTHPVGGSRAAMAAI
jgi:hypothetical protein